MKKNVFLLLVAASFCCQVFAQSGARQLKKYCLVDQSANFILLDAEFKITPEIKMSELTSDIIGKSVRTFFAVKYEWGHADVPLTTVANDTWLLISQQLDGTPGILSLSSPNCILTKDAQGVWRLVVAMWDTEWRKWHVLSYSVGHITNIKKGSLIFSL